MPIFNYNLIKNTYVYVFEYNSSEIFELICIKLMILEKAAPQIRVARWQFLKVCS